MVEQGGVSPHGGIVVHHLVSVGIEPSDSTNENLGTYPTAEQAGNNFQLR